MDSKNDYLNKMSKKRDRAAKGRQAARKSSNFC